MVKTQDMAHIRVVVADDHAFVRTSVRKLLDQEADMTVVGEARNGVEALELVKALQPDVLLLDMSMPGMRGEQVIRALKAERFPVSVLVLSSYRDRQYVQRTLASGVAGYVTKDQAPGSIIQAVRAVGQSARG